MKSSDLSFWIFRLGLLTLICLVTALSYRLDAGESLPADAAAAVAAYDKACAEAQAKADAAKVEAAKRLLPLLEVAQKKSTQKGDLDAATAVKAKREEVYNACLALTVGLTPAVSSDRLVGSWVVEEGAGIGKNFVFTRDGKWSSPWAGFGGSWTMENGLISLVALDKRPCTAELTSERTMVIKANVACTLKKQGR